MKKRLDKYDLELINKIYDLGDIPNIISFDYNKLDELWCRNYKDVIKIGTSMIIKGLKPNSRCSDDYLTNVYFEITPEQAEEIIATLQSALNKREKRI